ncbi:RadC family protein [Pedobacter cryophilus]|uniref:DNA repair protein RadC n=1 Tax=Pedobacter cryophilus TaxID=2571271 RepID=A0A4U1C166_9SPHI|nr:DNA repair protein RadC [Pedobacter cryophilus]TKB98785.1 DNA repair protein RadC [Pedobacter cryophilus]
MNTSYENKITIKAWAEEDRPREKLSAQGRRSLTDAELIAILIGSGSTSESAVDLSKRILHSCKNDLNALAKLSIQELSKFKGIGEAKAISIIAALELGRRRKEVEITNLDKITSSKDIFNYLSPYFSDLVYEEFWIILLNRANKIINKVLISKGGQAGTIADPKIIFKVALENNAANIVLAHNHPSGNLKPSHADTELTKKLRSAGLLLDISVIDHLIFSERAYFSFADEGML